MGINFTNAAKVIKAPNAVKVMKALNKYARNLGFFWAGKVSWSRYSLISFMLQKKSPSREKRYFLSKVTLQTAF